MKRPARLFCLLLTFTALNTDAKAQGSQSPPVPAEWLTHAERTDYRETPNYEDTLAYARKLAGASPLIRLTDFGRSGEGRPMALMIASTSIT